MKTVYIKNIFIGILLLFSCSFFSCSDDDDLNSVDMVVYLRPGGLDVKQISYTPIPGAVLEENNEIDFPVQITRGLASDATITLAVEESAVELYNEKNNSNFKFLTADMYTEISSKQLELKKGATSGNYKIKVNDPLKLLTELEEDQDGYIIPIKVVNLSSSDKGLRVSNDYNIAYLTVTFNPFTNIKEVKETLEGTVYDRAGWTASASNTWGGNASRTIDGNPNTYWASLNLGAALTVDMQGQEDAKGVRILSNYKYSASIFFFILQARISTSDDNSDWTSQGEADLILTSSGVDSYIYFYQPVNCRYIKIESTITYSSYGYTSISEIDVIK